MKLPLWGWLLPFALLLMAIVAVPQSMLEAEGLPRYHALKTELYRVKTHNRTLQFEIRELKQTVQALRTDLRAVEKVAREELGMIYPDEVVFQFAAESK